MDIEPSEGSTPAPWVLAATPSPSLEPSAAGPSLLPGENGAAAAAPSPAESPAKRPWPNEREDYELKEVIGERRRTAASLHPRTFTPQPSPRAPIYVLYFIRDMFSYLYDSLSLIGLARLLIGLSVMLSKCF